MLLDDIFTVEKIINIACVFGKDKLLSSAIYIQFIYLITFLANIC